MPPRYPRIRVLLTDCDSNAFMILGLCKARYKNGPFPGLKRGQSLQTKSLDRGRGQGVSAHVFTAKGPDLSKVN